MAIPQRNDSLRALKPLQTAVLLLTDDVNRELVRLQGVTTGTGASAAAT